MKICVEKPSVLAKRFVLTESQSWQFDLKSFHETILSQAAACDGTLITTSAENQEIVPGTLPTF